MFQSYTINRAKGTWKMSCYRGFYHKSFKKELGSGKFQRWYLQQIWMLINEIGQPEILADLITLKIIMSR